MDAVRAGNVHAARALYDAHMVDLNVVDKMDMNALHLAASCGQNDVRLREFTTKHISF